MLIPANAELPEILIGGTWETEIKLYEDKAETKAFSLVGWTTTLVFGANISKTLASGSGLTITAAEGKIVALMTATETEAFTVVPGNSPHYYIKLVKAAEVVFPLHGYVQVGNP